jgi:hypothetical protein
VAEKNQPSKKLLIKRVSFVIKHDFDEESLDPRNSPALVQQLQVLRAIFHGFADDPEGLEKMFLEKMFYEYVATLREEFVRVAPRLRIAYATVTKSPDEKEH